MIKEPKLPPGYYFVWYQAPILNDCPRIVVKKQRRWLPDATVDERIQLPPREWEDMPLDELVQAGMEDMAQVMWGKYKRIEQWKSHRSRTQEK